MHDTAGLTDIGGMCMTCDHRLLSIQNDCRSQLLVKLNQLLCSQSLEERWTEWEKLAPKTFTM